MSLDERRKMKKCEEKKRKTKEKDSREIECKRTLRATEVGSFHSIIIKPHFEEFISKPTEKQMSLKIRKDSTTSSSESATKIKSSAKPECCLRDIIGKAEKYSVATQPTKTWFAGGTRAIY